MPRPVLPPLRSVPAALSLVLLAACGSGAATLPGGAPPDSAAARVVAAENVWGDVVAQIGGPHVRVTSIITDPNADPHEYTSSTADAAAIAGARLVVANGLGYDGFVDRLLAASPNRDRRVLVLGTALRVGGDDPNPHIWYDVARVAEAARDIAADLERIDPADAAYMRNREAAFEHSLDPWRATIAAIRIAHAGTGVVYTERVPASLLAAAGLEVLTPSAFAQAVEAGDDPSAQAVAQMQATITSGRARVLLYNAQATSPITQRIRDLARSSGIPVVGVGETLPPGRTLQDWQIGLARALLVALG